MRLRSGRTIGRRRLSMRELEQQYPLFDFPVPRRHRKPSQDAKTVKVKLHKRRKPLQKL